jgi:hypothetical protein
VTIREVELGKLLAEIEKLKGSKGLLGKHELGEYQIMEQAAARLGMWPSYAYRLLYGPKTGNGAA